jgi:hypothetical protein
MNYCLGACANLGRWSFRCLANRYKSSELFRFMVTWQPVIHSSSLTFCPRFKMALRARGSCRHPARLDTVSAIRLCVWLALTPAGFPPACQSTIFSPHMQRLVRRVYNYGSDAKYREQDDGKQYANTICNCGDPITTTPVPPTSHHPTYAKTKVECAPSNHAANRFICVLRY